MKTMTAVLLVSSLAVGLATSSIAAAATPIHFDGTVTLWSEYLEGEWPEGLWYTTMVAEITAGAESFTLQYDDEQPCTTKTARDWESFHIYPNYSTWYFGDEDHYFEATGQIVVSYDADVPYATHSVGVYAIDGGTWGGRTIVGGRVQYDYILLEEIYYGTPGCWANLCPVSGPIHGTLMVE